VLCLALVAGTLARADCAWACSCASASPEEILELGPAAFIGTAVERRLEEGRLLGGSVRHAVYLFRVDEPLKGAVPRYVEVRTPELGASCGLEVRLGEPVALGLQRESGRWSSSLCSSSTSSSEDLEAFRAAALPSAQVLEVERPKLAPKEGGQGWLLIVVLVGALTLVVTGALLWRRRRRVLRRALQHPGRRRPRA
jgi:hypothetical protein